MAEGDDARSRWRPVVRRVLLWLSLLWAGFWVLIGIASASEPGYNLASELAFFGVGIGVVPWLPFWIGQIRRLRRRRRVERTRAEREAAIAARAESERRNREQTEKLPLAIRNEWERLERSRLLVQEFADEGWIEQMTLQEVDGHIGRLRRLLEADERTARLGGALSATLHTQVVDLTALLVALADAAVEHQAAMITGDPVPVTLAEARDRFTSTAEAYRDLQQPG
jgi:hypothetical protein